MAARAKAHIPVMYEDRAVNQDQTSLKVQYHRTFDLMKLQIEVCDNSSNNRTRVVDMTSMGPENKVSLPYRKVD